MFPTFSGDFIIRRNIRQYPGKRLWPNSTSHTFLEIMKNVGQALNLNISVHDLPSLLNRIQYTPEDGAKDHFQNFPCLTACDLDIEDGNFDLVYTDTYNFLHKFWKEYTNEKTANNETYNITDHMITTYPYAENYLQ